MSPAEIGRYYAQIDRRADALIELLRDHPVTNATAEGRVRGIAEWLKRELAARRVPIPLDRSYWGLIPMLIGSHDLDHIPGSHRLLTELRMLLDGEGILDQPRDDREVGRLLGLFVDSYLRRSERPRRIELAVMEDLQDKVHELEAGTLALPLDYDSFEARFPSAEWFGPLEQDDELADSWLDLSPTLFNGRRPPTSGPVRFEAPVAGLSPRAPIAPDGPID
ncbi:MAG TPA: hypothetical protein VF574_11810 [Allosphingosinicella sp.]|jgi:hypothetical protein